MKNNYLLLLLLYALTGYSQLATEGFENNGNQLPVGWQRIDIVGPGWQWQTVLGNEYHPQYQGDRVAHMGRENVAVGTAEDWLVTLQFLVPENGELTFYSRMRYEEDQGTTYRVMIHAGNTPTDISAYIQLHQWTELQINPVQTEYNKVTVPIPEIYTGMQVYIAFVMNGDFGDVWFVDDVGVQSSTMNTNEVKTNSLSFYPNPVNDRLTINGADEVLSVQVFDSNGRECISKNDAEGIDMTGLAAGLYIVKAVTAKGTLTRKVLKE